MEFDYKSPEWCLWELISPSPAFNNVKPSFRTYLSSLSLAKQRQIYYTLREQKRRGECFKENPLYVVQDCNPLPTNWNGKQGVNDLMKREKMVIAKFNGSFGTYTLFEARLFEMTHIQPLNYVLSPQNT